MNSEVEPVSLGPIDGILLSKGAKNKEKALEILQFLAVPGVNEALNSKSGAISPFIDVRDSTYSPLQLEIKNVIQKNTYWAFNYDLATEPFISEAGLEFFVEFMDNSTDYKALLNQLQKKVLDNNQS